MVRDSTTEPRELVHRRRHRRASGTWKIYGSNFRARPTRPAASSPTPKVRALVVVAAAVVVVNIILVVVAGGGGGHVVAAVLVVAVLVVEAAVVGAASSLTPKIRVSVVVVSGASFRGCRGHGCLVVVSSILLAFP